MDAITPTTSPAAGAPAPAPAALRQLRLTQAYAAPAVHPHADPAGRSPDSVTLGTIRPAGPGPMPEKARSLVAARVDAPAKPDAAPTAPATPGALPFYRHPADRNLAATAILAGKALDVRG